MREPPGGGLDDEDGLGGGGEGGSREQSGRTWVHPSEVGMERRGRRDRARTARLAGLVVLGGIGLLGAAAAMGLGWGEDTSDPPSPEDAVAPSLASLSVPSEGGTLRQVTGVVVDDDGHVAVNADALAAIKPGEQVTVSCEGGRTQPGEVVATDPTSGLAVLAMRRPAGQAAVAGDVPRLGERLLEVEARAGERDPAMEPVEVTNAGISRISDDGSVLQRLFVVSPSRPDSGPAPADGALYDDRGRFMGLLIASEDGDGVALPARTVLSVADALVNDGRVERAWIGVEVANLDPEEATERGLDGGAVIHSVQDGGPAHQAGLQAGDVVVAVEGRGVNGMTAFARELQEAGPGERLSLTVFRSGQRTEMPVTLGSTSP